MCKDFFAKHDLDIKLIGSVCTEGALLCWELNWVFRFVKKRYYALAM